MIVSGGRSRRWPSSARSIPSAWQSLPGPPARSPGRGFGPAPVRRHPLLPFDRLPGPDQHGAADVLLPGHRVQAPVHAVDEVDVGVPAGQVEALVARRAPASPGVAGAVGRAQIGLGLDQPEHQALAVQLADQPAPEEIPGDLARPAGGRKRGGALPDTGPELYFGHHHAYIDLEPCRGTGVMPPLFAELPDPFADQLRSRPPPGRSWEILSTRSSPRSPRTTSASGSRPRSTWPATAS